MDSSRGSTSWARVLAARMICPGRSRRNGRALPRACHRVTTNTFVMLSTLGARVISFLVARRRPFHSTCAKAKALGSAPTAIGVPGWLFDVRIGRKKLAPPVT
jgi:hypothetical protein